MSLRLIKKRITGIPLEDGTLVPWIMGAEGEGDPKDDDSNDEESDEEDEDEDDGDKPDPKDSATELDKMKLRMKAADRRAADAEKKAREYEDKDKSELEVASKRVSELEVENTALQGKLSELTRERHFLGSNTVTWHDPEIAMSKLDWKDIVDEDGDVDQTKLANAIKALAKSKPFLVKDNDDNEEQRRPAGETQQSGGPVGSGKKKKSTAEQTREELLKRFPALR